MRRFERAQRRHDDAVVLVVSGGLCDFVRNVLASIRRAGEQRCDIYIALPENALEEMQAALAGQDDVGYLLLEEIAPAGHRWISGYQEFKSDAFCSFTVAKWFAIRFLLQAGFRRVTFCDADVAWMRNPMPYLRTVLKVFDVAIQTEGTDNFPPQYCTGFMAFRASDFTMELLDRLEQDHSEGLKIHPKTEDQLVFNRTVMFSRGVVQRIFPLGELLFATGRVAWAMLAEDEELARICTSRVTPMVFHANWALGLNNKRRLLQRTGNWLVAP